MRACCHGIGAARREGEGEGAARGWDVWRRRPVDVGSDWLQAPVYTLC